MALGISVWRVEFEATINADEALAEQTYNGAIVVAHVYTASPYDAAKYAFQASQAEGWDVDSSTANTKPVCRVDEHWSGEGWDSCVTEAVECGMSITFYRYPIDG